MLEPTPHSPLQELGVPVAVAPLHGCRATCDDDCDISFDFPFGEERVNDPDAFLKFHKGDGMVAFTGHVFDVIDIDPQNNGKDAYEVLADLDTEGALPEIYGINRTPSGGLHLYVAPMGIGNPVSKQLGIDVRGEGGLVFIGPTEKWSKTTGEMSTYIWIEEPTLPEPGTADNFAAWYTNKLNEMRQVAYKNRGIDYDPTSDRRPSPLKTWREDMEIDGRNVTLNRVVTSLASYGEGRTIEEVEDELYKMGVTTELLDNSGFSPREFSYVVRRTTQQMSPQYGAVVMEPETGDTSVAKVSTLDPSVKDKIVLLKASEISSRRREWLWENVLMAGAPTLLGGQGGEGKSLFATHIAAQITIGSLPGDYHGKPSNVLYFTSEDDWETEQKSRLVAAGADMDRIYTPTWGGDASRPYLPKFPKDVKELKAFVREVKPALIVIDPISSFSGIESGNNSTQVRQMMDSFINVARASGSACLIIHHFNKGGGSFRNLVSGSHTYLDAVRAGLAFVYVKEHDMRYLGVIKGNYLPKGTGAYACTLQTKPMILEDGSEQIVPFYTSVQAVPTDLDSIIEAALAEGKQEAKAADKAEKQDSIQDQVNKLCDQWEYEGVSISPKQVALELNLKEGSAKSAVSRWRAQQAVA